MCLNELAEMKMGVIMANEEPSQVNLISHLDNLYETFIGYGDKPNAEILNTLRLKLERQEVVVACYGNVSSGKSRLLNVLMDEDNLLPVSPLSSSMNSVYIRPGKSLNINREQFQALCQDPNLECLELFWATLEGLSFIDTSGIDSIEGVNKQAENPLLLLADLVIYLTDYNHVESQVNFSFLKTLQSRKIPYVLIVNQIDKHVDLELSLADFFTKLTQSLKQWDLKPLRLYLTSLLEDKSPDCQLDQLKKLLSELRLGGANHVISTVIRSVRQVIHRHSRFFSEQHDFLREPHLWVKEQTLNEQVTLFAFQNLERQIEKITTLPQTIDSETITQINKLLKNAPLFSFEMRELAKQLLASRQPGFKAGFFASSAKTRSEQEQRLKKLHAELLTRSEANITWHLRKILAEIPARYDLPAENYWDQASQMNVLFDPELLLQTIRPGTGVSREYVMNFTSDLADALKSVYLQSGKVWIKRAQEAAIQKTRRELPSLQEQLETHRRMLGSLAELRRLDELHDNHMAELITLWEHASSQFTEDRLWTSAGNRQWTDKQRYQGLQGHVKSSKSIFPGLDNKKSETVVRRGHPKLREAVQDLTICSDLVTPLPGFSLKVNSLNQRVTRLKNNLFSVAFFGAFSAGKSSLANALLGNSVLPVSPNPTTATINKILSPTDRYPHGTTKVKLKSLPDLTADVLSSIAMFGLTATDLPQALLQIPSLDTEASQLEANPHLSFLRAVARDRSFLLEHLGEELTIDFLDFHEFVVSEDKACFVEGIELYFSCPLTELGVVLVDTPGSNSTNVRHTNVAFDYIKNADAVLFVTYYNNPFCKADAQFLSQLGKIKDTFEMNKLFFLVNASDLAQTPEELTLVLKHIEHSLRTYEIYQPRLFPVSSQLALLAKLASAGNLQPEEEQLYRRRLKLKPSENLPEPKKGLFDSGLKLFETNFYAFIEEDLITLAVDSANKEIRRIIHSVDGLLEAAKSEVSQRTEKLQHYRNLEQAILSGLEQISLITEETSISQEIDELIYYVNQRLSYRYSGLFDRNFFILMKAKEDQPKLAVQQCIRDFLQDIEVELNQELIATSLRTERFVQKSLNFVSNKVAAFVSHYDQQCSFQEGHKIPSQEEPRLPALDWDSNSLSKVAALYKNPKDWVEGSGRAKMLETVIKIIQPKIKAWLDECGETYKEFRHELFEQEFKKLKEQAHLEVSGYYSRLATALADGYDVNYLEQVRAELAGLAEGQI